MTDFHRSVVYQIYPRSFCDSDGDGIGDLRGVISKLDYIRSLGVDYLWLTPFYPSPQRDNGYDVSDYCAVDPRFGTMDDVDTLIRESDRRGIGLMFDLVLNHTSSDHEWFRRALSGDERYRKYYFFVDGSPDRAPTNWISNFGEPAWEYVPSMGKWYLHLFDVSQPDLNWDNPEVRGELQKIVRFWKDRGVRGFRFDAVNMISKPAVFEDDPDRTGRRFYIDGPHAHEYIHELVEKTGIGDMVTVGEMSLTSLENGIRYTRPENREFTMPFSFDHIETDYRNGDKWDPMPADLRRLKALLEKWQIGMQEGGGWNALYWCNHDQPRIVSRMGDEGRFWKQSAKMLAAAIHLMRCTPYVYQGEELGMTNAHFGDLSQYRDVDTFNAAENLRKKGKSEEEILRILAARSRDNARTPMQWNRGADAGFLPEDASARGAKPWIAIPRVKPEANVRDEEQDPDSILAWYRKLIALRKTEPLIADGKIRFLLDEPDAVLAYERYADGEDDTILVVLNLTGEHACAKVPGLSRGGRVLLSNYNKTELPAVREGEMGLMPYEVMVFRRAGRNQ